MYLSTYLSACPNQVEIHKDEVFLLKDKVKVKDKLPKISVYPSDEFDYL